MVAGLLLGGLAAAPPRQESTPTPPTVEATAAATETFAQPTWVSPTPDATGAVVVIVQPGESMWVIAARAGISLPELLAFNNLTEQSIINPGDALIVGFVTPEVVVAPEESTPTATPPPPTPRPTDTPPESAVCLTAFDDTNRNGIHDTGESLRAGVAFTVYNTEAVVANYITDGHSEPKCLGGLTPGEYRVTRSLAPGETLTTEGDWSLNLSAGGQLYQAFGSVMGESVAAAATPGSQSASSTPAALPTAAAPATDAGDDSLAPRLIGVAALFIGGLLLLGAVLILLFRQSRNQLAAPQADGTDGERRFRNIDDLE
jgi:LysM repeat protein